MPGSNSSTSKTDLHRPIRGAKRRQALVNTHSNLPAVGNMHKKRKESENEDLSDHFAFPHPLSPSTLISFRSASTSLFSHFQALGSSSQEAFVSAIESLCLKHEINAQTPKIATLRASFGHIPAPTFLAATLLCNELVHLQTSGKSLEEAVKVLTNRLQLNSNLLGPNPPQLPSHPLQPLTHNIQQHTAAEKGPTHLNQQSTTHLPFLEPFHDTASDSSSYLEDSEDLPALEEQEDESSAEAELETVSNDSGPFQPSNALEGLPLEDIGLLQLIDQHLPDPTLTGPRKRSNVDIAPHRSDLLNDLTIALQPKRQCITECPPSAGSS